MTVKLDHSEVVTDYRGDPLKNNIAGPHEKTDDGKQKETWVDLTFRDLALMALMGTADDERLGAEKKARCYQLSTKFLRGRHVKLSVDEAALVKERATVVLNSWTFGRFADWLEGKTQVVPTDDEDDRVDDRADAGGPDDAS